MKHLWTCGHTAEAMCAECWRELALKATALAAEIERLKETVDGILGEVNQIGTKPEEDDDKTG